MMERVVKAELLDQLPADDPGAVRSRRDIARLNFLMGHLGTLLALLHRGEQRPPRKLVELGAGDGRLMLRLARCMAGAWNRVELSLVDNKDAVTPETREAFAALGWSVNVVTADVFDWLRSEPAREPADAMVANLFLHHFSGPQLSDLLRLASARTRSFAACEPCRCRASLVMSRLVRWVGCNGVTRHDAQASVRAGFAGSELSGLWPAGREWRLHERSAGLFSHAFAATQSRSPYA